MAEYCGGLRDKSGISLYQFLVEDIDRHGRARVYFRRKGQPKIRLFEMPGTPAFEVEYQRAFKGEVKLPSASQHTVWIRVTLGWLCEKYYTSAVFQALDADDDREAWQSAQPRLGERDCGLRESANG